MRTINRFIAVILASTITSGLYSQTIVKGSVLDSLSREAEVGAVIQFYKSGAEQPTSYSVTDSTGHFSRSFNDKGDYRLLLQNVGRKTVAKDFKVEGQGELDLGTILLQDDAQTLNSVTVQAMKTLVKLDVGKLTYKAEQDPDSKTGTVLDMLRKVPMVTVDGQDNITVNGSSNFKVYVDGKPNQMISANPSQILKVMPASAIKEIEVITNPGAKYDAEGAGGVLNLVTGAAAGGSSAVADGVYGSVTLGYTTKGENGSLYVSAKKGKLTVGLNSSVGIQKLDGVSYTSLQKNLNDGSVLKTELEQEQKSPFMFADLNASYEIDPRNLVSGSFGMTRFSQRANSMTGMTMDGPAPYSYSIDQATRYGSSSLNGSFDFQHSSSVVPGRMLTLSYRYSGTPMKTEYTNRFSDVPFPLPDRQSFGNDSSVENTVQLDYTTPFAKVHSLSTGLKYIARHNSADDKLYLADGGSWIYNREGSMLYDHFNDIGAVYTEYTGSYGKVAVVLGARYEYTWQRVEYGEGYGHGFKTGFGDLVPNASIQFNIAPMQNIGLTFNRRIQRPGITYLNPYVDRSFPTNIRYGNSDLTSARSDILSLVYNYYNPKWVVSITGRYNHCGSGISSYSFYVDDVLNTTYGNIVREDNTGLTTFVNWNAGPKTRIFTNSSAGYGMYSSKELGMESHGWNWNTMIGLQQTLPADILLSANMILGGRTWNLEGWSDGFKLAVLGLSKGFFDDKLKISGQFLTNLDKGDMSMATFAHGKDYETRTVVSVPIRQVGISIAWNFGKQGFQVKKARHSIKNDDVINNSNGQAPGTGAGQVSM